MTDCGLMHTEHEEDRLRENISWARELIGRYYKHDGVACESCVHNAVKLIKILDGSK